MTLIGSPAKQLEVIRLEIGSADLELLQDHPFFIPVAEYCMVTPEPDEVGSILGRSRDTPIRVFLKPEFNCNANR